MKVELECQRCSRFDNRIRDQLGSKFLARFSFRLFNRTRADFRVTVLGWFWNISGKKL